MRLALFLIGAGIGAPTRYVIDRFFRDCGQAYDPVATRWLCPHCHSKTNCCDGAPCPIPEPVTLEAKGN
ncbi:MAG: hypothetical protein EB019_03795 [Actinobacteria bacterium]|nr:hypothetical protein [Actinomycetota bacterium]